MKYAEMTFASSRDEATKLTAVAVTRKEYYGSVLDQKENREVLAACSCNVEHFDRKRLDIIAKLIQRVSQEVTLKKPDLKIVIDYTIELRWSKD